MDEYINLTPENIDGEHLCCAIGDPKHKAGVDSKKEWLKQRLSEGHVFRKLNVKGKVFIEYAPLESAWTPVNADNYIYIYCLWVSGRYKGSGYAKELLKYALNDAKSSGKSGICTISSKKKKPFISDKKFFEHFGFKTADSVGDYELLALPFGNELPRFNDCVRNAEIDSKDFTIYYSPQCPYAVNGIGEISEYAKENGIPLNIVKVDSLEKAKQVPCIFNNWANFKDGKFISNTLLNKNSFEKLIK